MTENGSKNFRVLQQEGVNFESLIKKMMPLLDRKPTEKDVLYGKTKIFIQEDYKDYLDKVLIKK